MLTGYAIYYNLRYKRTGHLFQNRYKSIVCDEDAYLLELVRYINLNPLRAGLVDSCTDLDDYPWTGHAVIMGNGKLEGQVVDGILTLFSKEKPAAKRNYHQFIADGVTQGKRDDLTSSGKRQASSPDEAYDARILGDGDFVEEIRTRKELTPLFPTNISISELTRRICNRCDVGLDSLQRRTRAPAVTKVRSIVCYLAVRKLSHNGAEVGRQLGISRSGVSVAVDRGELLAKKEPEYLALIDK